jgi:hypothetical protein
MRFKLNKSVQNQTVDETQLHRLPLLHTHNGRRDMIVLINSKHDREDRLVTLTGQMADLGTLPMTPDTTAQMRKLHAQLGELINAADAA